MVNLQLAIQTLPTLLIPKVLAVAHLAPGHVVSCWYKVVELLATI
jgi:hypothetical protein